MINEKKIKRKQKIKAVNCEWNNQILKKDNYKETKFWIKIIW